MRLLSFNGFGRQCPRVELPLWDLKKVKKRFVYRSRRFQRFTYLNYKFSRCSKALEKLTRPIHLLNKKSLYCFPGHDVFPPHVTTCRKGSARGHKKVSIVRGITLPCISNFCFRAVFLTSCVLLEMAVLFCYVTYDHVQRPPPLLLFNRRQFKVLKDNQKL